MFGFRADGRRLSSADPIIRITPYIMPMRCDAQVMCQLALDYEPLAQYIKEKQREGHNISFMTIVLAGYVRAVSQHPELNRFISNKQIFARNRISVSFVVLRTGKDKNSIDESLAKVEFDPTDTIFDVEKRVNQAIEICRNEESGGSLTDKFARAMLLLPGLPTAIVALARLLDRYGLLPKLVYDASPFHTGLFITNMASINMTSVYHHLYNFGTTSVFLALGKLERTLKPLPGGGTTYKNQLPLGLVVDERIMGGANYGKCFEMLKHYMTHPELLETPPDEVKTETAMRKARPVKAS